MNHDIIHRILVIASEEMIAKLITVKFPILQLNSFWFDRLCYQFSYRLDYQKYLNLNWKQSYNNVLSAANDVKISKENEIDRRLILSMIDNNISFYCLLLKEDFIYSSDLLRVALIYAIKINTMEIAKTLINRLGKQTLYSFNIKTLTEKHHTLYLGLEKILDIQPINKIHNIAKLNGLLISDVISYMCKYDNIEIFSLIYHKFEKKILTDNIFGVICLCNSVNIMKSLINKLSMIKDKSLLYNMIRFSCISGLNHILNIIIENFDINTLNISANNNLILQLAIQHNNGEFVLALLKYNDIKENFTLNLYSRCIRMICISELKIEIINYIMSNYRHIQYLDIQGLIEIQGLLNDKEYDVVNELCIYIEDNQIYNSVILEWLGEIYIENKIVNLPRILEKEQCNFLIKRNNYSLLSIKNLIAIINERVMVKKYKDIILDVLIEKRNSIILSLLLKFSPVIIGTGVLIYWLLG